MDRRNFLSSAGAVGAFLMPGFDFHKILGEKHAKIGTPTTIGNPGNPGIPGNPGTAGTSGMYGSSAVPRDDMKLTDDFFTYLKNNIDKVKFNYERVFLPSLLAYSMEKYNDNGIEHDYKICCHPRAVSTRKMRVALSEHSLLEQEDGTYIPDFIFSSIVDELNVESLNKNGKLNSALYIYQVLTTPTVFSPEDYSPRRGIMVRYAKLTTDGKILTCKKGTEYSEEVEDRIPLKEWNPSLAKSIETAQTNVSTERNWLL
jgi:hypothetical protein